MALYGQPPQGQTALTGALNNALGWMMNEGSDGDEGCNDSSPEPRFIGDEDGNVVDTEATPKGAYQQPNGGRTDVLQGEDHGAGQSHTHDPVINTNPQTGESFINGLQKPGRPVSAQDVKNIINGSAKPYRPKGR